MGRISLEDLLQCRILPNAVPGQKRIVIRDHQVLCLNRGVAGIATVIPRGINGLPGPVNFHLVPCVSRFRTIRSGDITGHNNRTETRFRRQEMEDVRVAFTDGCSLEENATCIVVGSEFRGEPMRLWIWVCPDLISPLQALVVVRRMGNNPRVDCSYLGCVIHARLDDVGNNLVC